MKIKDDLDKKANFNDLSTFLDGLKIKIGTFGGRRFYLDNEKGSLSLNDIVNQFMKIRDSKENEIDCLVKIYDLDIKANQKLNDTSTNRFQKIMTKIKQVLFRSNKQRDRELIEKATAELELLGSESLKGTNAHTKEQMIKVETLLKKLKELPNSKQIITQILNNLLLIANKDSNKIDTFILILQKTEKILDCPLVNSLNYPPDFKREINSALESKRLFRQERIINLVSDYSKKSLPIIHNELLGHLGEITAEGDLNTLFYAINHLASDQKKFEILIDAINEVPFDGKLAFFKRIIFENDKLKEIIKELEKQDNQETVKYEISPIDELP